VSLDPAPVGLQCGISQEINKLTDWLDVQHHILHMQTRIYVTTPEARGESFYKMKEAMQKLEVELIKQGEIR